MAEKERDLLGGRLPLRDPSTMTGPERQLYDSIMSVQAVWGKEAGFKMATKDGRLLGPFNAFLLNPEITRKLLDFDESLKKHVSFSERVREVIILAVGGVWASSYELYAHAILGRSVGLESDVIQALSSGELPKDLAESELLAARVAQGIARNYRIDDALFNEAEQHFGQRGLYEMANLIGEFFVTCTILNMFEVPVPDLKA